MAKAPLKSSDQGEIIRIQEEQRTRRQGYAILGGVASLGIIAWAAVRMTEKPSWLVLALAILGAASGPSVLVAIGFRYVRRWTAYHVGRTAELEKQIDPDRSSSALNPDGTDPPGALP